MLAGIWNKFTSPTERFVKGKTTNPTEAETANKVGKLESLVRDIGVTMAAIDDNGADKNSDPGRVYGTVYTPTYGRQSTPFTGLCELDKGEVATLDVRAGSNHLTVARKGNRKEIHYVNKIEGSGYAAFGPGGNILEHHEWAIFDGSEVKYKSYSFFSNNGD